MTFQSPSAPVQRNPRVGGSLTPEQLAALPAIERLTHVRVGGTVVGQPATINAKQCSDNAIARSVFDSLSPHLQHEALHVRRLTVID